MLELRPSCEHCDTDLAADNTSAMICSYECTFCDDCVNDVMKNVCPNCGGGFCYRPVRPRQNLRNDNYLGNHPATLTRTLKPVNVENHTIFANKIKLTKPESR